MSYTKALKALIVAIITQRNKTVNTTISLLEQERKKRGWTVVQTEVRTGERMWKAQQKQNY